MRSNESKDEPVIKLVEKNRMLVIPEAFYAGGLYRTPFDLGVKEWERVHYLYASDIEILQEKGE
jgi:hypothetical protein